MQGLFVGDHETPIECLKRDLKARLDATVEILNTGHLGYSPSSIITRCSNTPSVFRPTSSWSASSPTTSATFRTCSTARATGKKGPTGWAGSGSFACRSAFDCLVVPAPWVNQIEGPQMAGNYPGMASNFIEAAGIQYLDPIDEFANALLERDQSSRSDRV